MGSYRDYFADVKKRVREATPQQVQELLKGDVQLGDVREKNEWDEGHLPGAAFVPKSYLEQWAEDRLPSKDKPTILYCAGGVRSVMAADALQKLGYTNVISMSGGFNRWKDAGLPWTKPETLGPEQAQRYSRHLLIPEIGERGQLKLLKSSVLLIGAGGLGSPAGLYLAAAGVGTLGIVDSDVVDATNLQRQILHNTERLGRPKDESVKHSIPVVHGSIYRFEGQATVFKPFPPIGAADRFERGPCYRCLFHEPPPPELAPSCAEAGVLGVLPGIIGSIQANEAIKLLLGIGEPLIGRLLAYDALEESFRTFKVNRDPECAACSIPAEQLVIA